MSTNPSKSKPNDTLGTLIIGIAGGIFLFFGAMLYFSAGSRGYGPALMIIGGFFLAYEACYVAVKFIVNMIALSKEKDKAKIGISIMRAEPVA
jgi:hypothetical protein